MSVLTTSQSLAFINGAKLPAPAAAQRLRRAPAFEDEEPPAIRPSGDQALVVGSGLIVAADGVPAQTRADLVDCTLFAQLSASGRVPAGKGIEAWYDAYFETLTALGWAQSDRRFEKLATKTTQIEAHKAIVKVLAAVLGPQAAALTIVTETFDALQSMHENSPWITLFDQQSTHASSARFQVATAQPTKHGVIEIALVAFELKARVQLTQVLFFKFKASSTTLKYASGHATIYEAALAQNRAAIAARLQAYRKAYIGEVKFPPVTR